MSAEGAMATLVRACGRELTLVDVGARWGVNPRWSAVGDVATVICFEPDGEECARLNATAPGNVRYLPYGLAEREGTYALHVTTEPACSSLHQPIENLHRHYPPLAITRPVHDVEIACHTLDGVAEAERIGPITALKLDTQGSELDILRGARRSLETCCLIDIEVEFNPLYEGQGLFCDVDRFLRDSGFVLWRLENLVHYAPELMAAARASFLFASDPEGRSIDVPNGQLFWAQAQYVRAAHPRTCDDPIPEVEGARAALASALYGFWDLALEIARKTSSPGLYADLKRELGA